MTPVEYEFAAEQAIRLLHDGYGVIARFREHAIPHMRDHIPYELDGWLKHNAEIVNKWHQSKERERQERLATLAQVSDHQS